MNINFTGHHIDVTPPLKNYINEKFERIKKHFDKIIKVDITLEIEKIFQVAKATIHVSGAKIHADAKSEDMYKSIDQLMDKLDRLVKAHKEKQKEHR